MDADTTTETEITAKVIDSLYVEAMVLADDARAYFDNFSREEREGLGPVSRVAFSCEALKVTTRLMHVIAWLLARKAHFNGESGQGFPNASDGLGVVAHSDDLTLTTLPTSARSRIAASIDLYDRVLRLDGRLREVRANVSPARDLMQQLARSF